MDFSEFTFIRALLGKLHSLSPERFDIVVTELRKAWVARMRNMLGQIGPNAVLLWFARVELSNEPWNSVPNPLQVDPLFITESMIDELRPLVRDVVQAVPSDIAKQQGTKGMYFPPMQAKVASEMLGVACHSEASNALMPVIKTLL